MSSPSAWASGSQCIVSSTLSIVSPLCSIYALLIVNQVLFGATTPTSVLQCGEILLHPSQLAFTTVSSLNGTLLTNRYPPRALHARKTASQHDFPRTRQCHVQHPETKKGGSVHQVVCRWHSHPRHAASHLCHGESFASIGTLADKQQRRFAIMEGFGPIPVSVSSTRTLRSCT